MSTIASLIEQGHMMWVNCGICQWTKQMDLPALAQRLGPDNSVMHWDITPKFKCQRCADIGDRRRDVFLTVIPDYARLAARPMNKSFEPPRS